MEFEMRMVQKRDLYLIPNQKIHTWLLDESYSIFYFFFFFSVYQMGWRKFYFSHCPRDFNTKISNIHAVPDKLANHFHVHLVQLLARYCNQKSLLKAKLSSHFNQTLAKSAASVLSGYIISEIWHCDCSSVLEGKWQDTI